MPKQRSPFDTQRYESLKAQGLSQRAIAEQLGMPEATLRNNLKVLAKAVAQSIGEGSPLDDQGIPYEKPPKVHLGTPEGDYISTPEGDNGAPPLYIHPGIPDDGEESPVGGEDIEGVHEGIPALPLTGIHESDQGRAGATLSLEMTEALTTIWPELMQLLQWWRMRQQAQEMSEKLTRTTWHVAPRWVEAVKREADLTGESYTAVVNRALRQYFEGKTTGA